MKSTTLAIHQLADFLESEKYDFNMAIGAAHVGCRTMCATSGGGFALMTEAVGAASMMEIPVVFIDVQRAGPSTGGVYTSRRWAS